MLDWDKLRVFYNVVESGSFTHAAHRLQIGQSAISRQISSLENRMGAPLFYRHARGLLLTEQGEILFQRTREVFAELIMAETRLTDNAHIIQRTLTLTASVGFGTAWLAQRLHKFLNAQPDIRLILKLSDDPVDLTVHESDVALTVVVHEDTDLIYRELLKRPLYLYASRSYLLQYGVPLTLQDLDHHRLVVFDEKDMVPFDNVGWLLTCGAPPGIQRDPYVSINSLLGIAKAVEQGSGIACLPPYVAANHDLVQILPDVQVPWVHFYFVFPKALKDSKKIDSLWNFLVQEAQEEDFLY